MRVTLFVLCAICSPCVCAHKISQGFSAELVASEESGARNAFKEALPVIEALEKDVSRVQVSSRKASLVLAQMSETSAQRNNKDATNKVRAPTSPKTVLSQGKAGKPFGTEDAVKKMSKLGVHQMPAMLGLVKGMYTAWKDKISFVNKHEQSGKMSFEQEIKDLEAKKRKYKGDTNATKTYDHIEKYWKRQRELAHRQYHTALKIMHSGMSQFKTVMSALQDAVAGKPPAPDTLRAMQRVAPEVVFLQMKVKELAVWTKGAVALLRDSRNAHPGMAHSFSPLVKREGS